MTWDHSHETDMSVEVTPLARRLSRLSERRLTESITLGATQLESEITWKLWFHHPDTRTNREVQEEFEALVEHIIEGQRATLTKCLMIVGRLPEQVVPTVLDQLQEIAEYETRVWHFQVERGDKPSIGEDMRALPVGRE